VAEKIRTEFPTTSLLVTSFHSSYYFFVFLIDVLPCIQIAFPLLLHKILDLVEDQNQSHILSWTSNGTALQIHDPKEFSKSIIPTYFPGMSQYKSFLKQLGLYGFARVQELRGVYHHPLFVRHDRAACSQIQRKKVSRKKRMAFQHVQDKDVPPMLMFPSTQEMMMMNAGTVVSTSSVSTPSDDSSSSSSSSSRRSAKIIVPGKGVSVHYDSSVAREAFNTTENSGRDDSRLVSEEFMDMFYSGGVGGSSSIEQTLLPTQREQLAQYPSVLLNPLSASSPYNNQTHSDDLNHPQNQSAAAPLFLIHEQKDDAADDDGSFHHLAEFGNLPFFDVE
jgi:hypothetical protein